MIRATVAAFALLAAAAGSAAAPSGPIQAAIANPSRPASDTGRDAERKPAEMLAFAGVAPGMTVEDVMPGSGYFTRLFADAVGSGGKVIAYVPDEVLAKFAKALDGVTAIAAEVGHGNVEVVHRPLLAPGPENAIDVVWTSQNYHDLHNMPGADVITFNRLVYRSLKPGGVYVVLDHSAPAGSGLTATNTTHRIDQATVRKEIEAAGFKYDGESKVLANSADPRTAKVFDPSIRGHTDQFVMRFRKP
jgi:predicted methyltransferase